MNKIRIAILGSGNIGTDLLIKTMRSPYLECSVFIGRNAYSSGILKAQSLQMKTSIEGIDYIKNNPDCCDIVFDATSAKAHLQHAPMLSGLDKFVIDLTPAKIGTMCIPVVNLMDCLDKENVNMVTCGGQASIPIIHAIAQTQLGIEYIEVVSSIASRSAGPATRLNLDEYIHTTEEAIKLFSGVNSAKAILNLNPAQPCINMQTTIFAKVSQPNLPKLQLVINTMLTNIQRYVPGYQIIVNPMIEHDRIVVMVRVQGQGDYLPAYAGNLDIINCAALAVAEEYAKQQLSLREDFHHALNIA